MIKIEKDNILDANHKLGETSQTQTSSHIAEIHKLKMQIENLRQKKNDFKIRLREA